MKHSRGYFESDLEVLKPLGICLGVGSVVLLTIYANQLTTEGLYQSPIYLLGICLLLLFWIGRVWLMINRKEMASDPILFAIKDHVSRFLILLVVALGVFASF